MNDFKLESACAHGRLYRCGETLLRLDFLSQSLFRFAIYREGERLLPSYSVLPEGCEPKREGRDRLSVEGFELFEPLCSRGEDAEVFKLGEVEIRLETKPLRLSYYKNGETLFADREMLPYNLNGELGEGARHYVTRQRGERIFGLGDKGGAVNKAGRRLRVDASDCMGYDAETSDPLYRMIPFCICQSERGCYGLYYDTHAVCEFDLGAEINNYYGDYKYFQSEESALVCYVFFGSEREIVRAFKRLCGKDLLSPEWSLRYCGSTMAYTDAENADELLRGFADKCALEGYDCGGFYLSSGYTSIGKSRCVFNWNFSKIPDPAAMSDYFRERGIELIANIKPAFLTSHPMYGELAERGLFLKYPNGLPALFPFWDGVGSYLDFSKPEGYDFWVRMVREKLIAYGIRCTWNDNNEFDVRDRSVLADCFGSPAPAYLMRPALTALMAMASHEAAAGSGGELFSVTRAGPAGISRYATTWSGDNRSEWKTLRGNHRMAMTMSISGIYNFGHDIGGFAGDAPEPELFMRWLQNGVFTPRFCMHSWNPDGSATMPWMYPELRGAVADIFALRQRLLPCLYDALHRSVEEYEPIISPVFLSFPGFDPESDLFMLSDCVLVANVFDRGKTRVRVELPENNGGWYRSGRYFEGGSAFELESPVEGEPVWFMRGGSVLCSREGQRLRFTVCPLDFGEFSRELYPSRAEHVSLCVVCEAERVTVYYSGDTVPELTLCDRLGRELVALPGGNRT